MSSEAYLVLSWTGYQHTAPNALSREDSKQMKNNSKSQRISPFERPFLPNLQEVSFNIDRHRMDVTPPPTRTTRARTTGSAFDTKLFRAGQGGFEDTCEVQVFMFQYTLTDHDCGSWCILFGKLKTIFHCKYGSNHAVL
ncbi:hypothetical protein BofuT4_P037840.1 [Botrytis cinerea T4]|uniref:Uncharacterized protein n=1 Tax=Botryotinia fuckeliana (strain T4) TaxID=999810 RepID=G2Y564_BOTF4|nr:hypothetical protein BofuT4_P037840.1 [Botrytis cinerea T4]